MKKKTRKNETGRSMVEMLGVLAIVGVLSAGGVYGYGIAMKKHKANELLHQASMLAATISAQALTNDGKLPTSITSFGNSSYGTFSTSATDALDGKGFSITIENVDSAVCDQLKIGGMIQDVNCVDSVTLGKKDAQITYYKNLATTPEEGQKGPTGAKPDPCDSVKCETGQECFSGICKSIAFNNCEENEDFCCLNLSGSSLEFSPCGSLCEEDFCPTNTVSCTKNNDCLGQKVLGSICQSGDCYCMFMDTLDDGTPYFGQCVPFTDYEKQEKISETDNYSYWSAFNFCKALNSTITTTCNENNCPSMTWLNDTPSNNLCKIFMEEIQIEDCNQMMGHATCKK